MKYLFAFVFAFSFGALASCTPVFYFRADNPKQFDQQQFGANSSLQSLERHADKSGNAELHYFFSLRSKQHVFRMEKVGIDS